MSGGPVLDSRGRVIGIHGRAEEEKITNSAGQNRRILLGFSLGVPVGTFLSQAQVVGMKPEFVKVETSAPPPLTEKEKDSISAVLLKVEKPSNSADAIDWLNYGWQLARLGDEMKKPAIAAIDRAIQLNPNFYQAWYLRGFLLLSDDTDNKDKYEQALKSRDKATQIEPGFDTAWRWRGLVLFSLKRYQEALESFDKVVQYDPKNADYIRYRGNIRRALKDYKGAIADYTEAIRLKPNNAEAYWVRGEARFEQKDIKGALADLNEAVRLDPKDANYIKERGAAHVLLKDYQSAIADFTVAIRLKPDDAQVYLLRGQTRTQLKDYQGAIEDYSQVLRSHELSGIGIQSEVNPQTKLLTIAKVIENSAAQKGGVKVGDQILEINGQPTANMTLEQAIKLIRGETGTQVTLRIARADGNAFNIKLSREPLAIDTKFAEVFYNRGLARAKIRDNQKARQDCQKAADLYKQQGKINEYQDAVAKIKQLPQ